MDEIFGKAGARGWVHARCFDCDAEFGAGADEPVVLASVVKVPLVLEFARQVMAGQLDSADRVRVRASDRLGGIGTAGCLDDVELSLRDAAFFTLSLSDNTAADLLFDRVGVDNVRSLLRELGLTATRVAGAQRYIWQTMAEDIGARDADEFARRFPALSADEIFGTRALDPLRTTASTAREMTRLLTLIGTDAAAPPEACRWVRDLMRQQVAGQRLPSAFGSEIRLWSKTGTLPGIRNEIGVVEYPDGNRYAVAVFTRSGDLSPRQPELDRLIGVAARQAVECLDHHPHTRHPTAVAAPPAPAPGGMPHRPE